MLIYMKVWGIYMEHKGRRILVQDLDSMVNFYKSKLGAELLDQTDSSAYLAIEDDVVELVLGLKAMPETAIAIQFTDELAFNNVCNNFRHFKNFSVRLIRDSARSTYKAEIKDIENNIIHLYHHELLVPTS